MKLRWIGCCIVLRWDSTCATALCFEVDLSGGASHPSSCLMCGSKIHRHFGHARSALSSRSFSNSCVAGCVNKRILIFFQRFCKPTLIVNTASRGSLSFSSDTIWRYAALSSFVDISGGGVRFRSLTGQAL